MLRLPLLRINIQQLQKKFCLTPKFIIQKFNSVVQIHMSKSVFTKRKSLPAVHTCQGNNLALPQSATGLKSLQVPVWWRAEKAHTNVELFDRIHLGYNLRNCSFRFLIKTKITILMKVQFLQVLQLQEARRRQNHELVFI